MPATLVGERYAVQRELIVLPFVVLIATFGAMFLLRHSTRFARLAGVALLLAMPVQFAAFYYDYFNDYRIRSAFWFDPANFRGVAEFLLSAKRPAGRRRCTSAKTWMMSRLDGASISRSIDGRICSQRTSLFSARDLDVSKVPAGQPARALRERSEPFPALLGPEKCAVASVVTDISGGRSAVILRKASLTGAAFAAQGVGWPRRRSP